MNRKWVVHVLYTDYIMLKEFYMICRASSESVTLNRDYYTFSFAGSTSTLEGFLYYHG